MFLIVSFSGRSVYDPNPLRPNHNPKKLVQDSCRVYGLDRTLTPLPFAVNDHDTVKVIHVFNVFWKYLGSVWIELIVAENLKLKTEN